MVELTTMQKIINFVTESAVKYSFHVLGGLVVLTGSWILSNVVAKFVSRSLSARKIDVSIIKFLSQAVRLIIIALGALMMLSSFGVQIAPLIAGLSVAGVGIGLALQGPLSNYIAGATLIFTKPFKVGDIIEVNGFQGQVSDISLPRTELFGLDGSIIVIPNKHIIGEVVKNFSIFRKLEINIGVAYDSNVKKAISLLENIIKSEERIPDKEVYKVGIDEFADSAINLRVVVWVSQIDYLDVKFRINNAILEQFSANGIVIPFPQRDVHIYQKPA